MVLAYVRLFERQGVRLAAINLVIGTIVGVICGWLAGRVVATLTWTLLGGTLALLCVLSADRLPIEQQLYWLTVGLGGGMFAGAIPPGNARLRGISVLAIWCCLLWRSVVQYHNWSLVLLDAVVTLPALGGLAILAEVYSYFEHRHRTPLDLWAAALILAVVAGNFGAIVVWNLWYAV
jgi:hypothetical protein